MSYVLTIIEKDDSEAVILPPEILEKLGVKTGDKIFLAEKPDGYCLYSDELNLKKRAE